MTAHAGICLPCQIALLHGGEFEPLHDDCFGAYRLGGCACPCREETDDATTGT